MLKLFFSLAVLFSFYCLGQKTPANVLTIGQLAPYKEFLMPNTQGGTLSLNNAKDQNGLLVIFSCNSCPFVVGTPDFPGWENTYNLLYKEASRNKIGMVLINSNEGKRTEADSFEKMTEHAQNNKYLMPYLMDSNSALADAFGAKTTPHVFLFDQQLHLVYVGAIDNMADNKRKKALPYLINALLAQSLGKKPSPNTTSPVGCSIKRIKKSEP